jgi:uncharacterized protein
MLSDPWFYAAAIPAVVIVGLGKGGFGGASVLGAPLLSLVVPPLEAAAIMLPILVAMDVVAVSAWWRVFDRKSVIILLPGMLLGVAIGWAIAAHVTDEGVRLVVGVIAVGFTLSYLLRGGEHQAARQPNRLKGTFWGAVGGFTSFVSHAGGPPVQMYLLPLKLDPKLVAGTSVLVFAATNAAKLLPYAALGQFTTAHLAVSAVLLPLAPISTFLGARLIKIVPMHTFYRVSYALLFLVGLKLLYDGARSL